VAKYPEGVREGKTLYTCFSASIGVIITKKMKKILKIKRKLFK
jgi:hypothetical protein